MPSGCHRCGLFWLRTYPLNLIRIIPAEEKNMKKQIFFFAAPKCGQAKGIAYRMMLCSVLFVATTIGTSYGQTTPTNDSVKVKKLHSVIISNTYVDHRTPLTTVDLDRQQLDDERLSVSIPQMLETQPSVVATGENGAVGATAIRIRGVDASRINVNINGITLNDPESQSVFWYNIPNISGIANNIQIQRGLGASTGGSPAFGAAINLTTLNSNSSPYGKVDMGLGSWNTSQSNFTLGTGIMKNGLSFDFAYSSLTSDGFVRSAGTDQRSFFGSAAWYGDKTLVKFIALFGSQTTGITWDGADAEKLDEDPTYNPSGEFWMDGNIMYYPNETDNYWQRHYQLYLSHFFSDNVSMFGTFNFTHGDGYYEQYKADKKFSKYDLALPGRSDFVTRKQMDNDAFAVNIGMRYSKDNWNIVLGDNMLYHDGFHFGNVIWCRDTAASVPANYEWYRYEGIKIDNSPYLKLNCEFSPRLNGYADLQARIVQYSLEGDADDLFMMDFSESYLFFNPKAGLNYIVNDKMRTYIVAGVSNREPTKSDIKDAIGNNDTIKAERMLDIEAGAQYAGGRFVWSANGYAMLYKDQLSPNGDLSSSGYSLMENVDKSYRLGIELQCTAKLTKWMRADANVTLSTNKIIGYSFLDFNDGDSVVTMVKANTPLALSPSVVGAATLTFTPMENARLQLIAKYVGKQYADNTGRECYAIDPYFLINLRASYEWHLNGGETIEAQLQINNLLNHQYRQSAWVSDWVDDWSSSSSVYYHSRAWLQQPGTNFMARLVYMF